MGFFETISIWGNKLFAPVLGPVLDTIGPFWTIVILSLVVSLAITLVYKFATNQKKLKEIKDEMKAKQKQAKELQKTEPDKAMALQKEVMSKNMEYMKHSMKISLITMLPMLLFLGWMQYNLAFEPINVGEEFTVKIVFEKGLTGEVEVHPMKEIEILSEEKQKINSELEWKFKALKEGDYLIDFKQGDKIFSKEILVTDKQRYAPQIEEHKGFGIIQVDYQKLGILGNFHLRSWRPGWLALYITFSLITSILLRKVFKLN